MIIRVNKLGYIYAENGTWLPPLNAKQFEVFNDFHRYLLVHGPRKSGKTFGLIHKTLRHAWDVDGAMVAIICKTIKNAKSAGVWVLLTKMLNIWSGYKDGSGNKVPGCGKFTVVEGPKITGDSKMSFVRIRNAHGTISEIQCHSLEHSSEVEAKFKGPAYSMIWCSEADQYLDEHAFHILCDALRMWPGVKYEEHQIILDMNPPDTGENNWFHDVFFKFKDKQLEEDEDEIFKEGLHRIGFSIDDNPQLDPKEKRELIARYKKRKSLYNRFILGIWEQDITGGHYSDVWDEMIHVRGSIDGPEEDWEFIVPTQGCTHLLTGWDMGESKNHSFTILEKVLMEDPNTKRQVVSFAVIDEYVIIRTQMSIREFVEVCLEKIDHWTDWQQKMHKVELSWRHWSDTSALDYRASADSSDAAIVYEASNERIVLQGAPKYSGSNRDKVKLLWQLLYERRLHISAQLKATRAMFANLRPDPNSAAHFVKRDDHKHPFDSLAYPIIAEAPTDMLKSAELTTAPKERSPGLIISRI